MEIVSQPIVLKDRIFLKLLILVVEAPKSGMCANPEVALMVFIQVGYLIFGQAVFAPVARSENGKPVSVELIESVFGSQPEEAVAVLHNFVDAGARQSVFYGVKFVYLRFCHDKSEQEKANQTQFSEVCVWHGFVCSGCTNMGYTNVAFFDLVLRLFVANCSDS